jgi:O-antigen/teichoic acid export membrane protein
MIVETPIRPASAETAPDRAVTRVLTEEVRKLALHASHYAAGFIGALIVGLVSFPVFTRVFPVAEYGTIDLAQKLLVLVWAASKMGLQNAALRFHDAANFSANPLQAQRYYSTLFFGITATSAVVLTLFLAGIAVSPESLVSPPVTTLIHLIAVVVLLRSLTSMLWSFLRIEERTKTYNAIAVGEKMATVAVVCLLLPFGGRRAETYFAGYIVVQAAIVVFLTIPLLRRGMLAPRAFDPALFRTCIAFGLPLVAYEWAFGILGSTDRLMVRNYLGADALGFYAVASGLAQHANDLLIAPLTLALTPLYMRLWNTEGREKTISFLTQALDVYLMAAVGILAITAASASHIVVLLASSKYAGAHHLIPVLLAAFLIFAMNIFLGAGFFIHKRTVYLAGLLMISAVLNLGLNRILLPQIGLAGGAVATLVSYTIFVLWLARASRSVLPLRINPISVGRYAAAAVLAWSAGVFVDVESTAAGLVLTAGISAAVYCTALYALDSRVREAVWWAAAWVRQSKQTGRAELESR